MEAPEIRYTESRDGVRIAFWTLGSGRTLISLPPLPHSHIGVEWDVRALRRQYDLAADHVTLVRYDARGTGLSERDVDDFSLDAMQLDLEAVMDAIGAERAALEGAVNSAAVAVAYAARHPERVSHLVLWCPIVDGAIARENSKLHAARHVLQSDWEMFVQTIAHTLVGWSEPEVARQYAEVIRAGITPQTLLEMVGQIHQYDARDALSEVRCPTLILHRPHSPIVPHEHVEHVAATIAGAQLEVLEGPSSVPFVGDWRAAVRPIVEFLQGSDGAGRPANGRSARLLSMRTDVLSPREREVVALIEEGLTNRQIAERLVLAEKTVENHVSRILLKLDLPSRTRLAVYAAEQRLMESL